MIIETCLVSVPSHHFPFSGKDPLAALALTTRWPLPCPLNAVVVVVRRLEL